MSDLALMVGAVVVCLLLYGLGSGAMALLMHVIFGPDMGPRQQVLADKLAAGYEAAGRIMVGIGGALRYVRGGDDRMAPHTSSPQVGHDTKQQIMKQ